MRRADAQGAGQVALAQHAQGFVVDGQQLPRVLQQLLAVPRQVLATPLALEQRQPDLLLQPLHLLGHGRLRALHGFGGRAKGLVVGNGHQGTQQVQVKITHSLDPLMDFRCALSGFQDRCSLQ
ncbi:hypothetical protein D3C87_1488370 [compost metagenome]